jgi:hypothetical protein
MVNLKLIVGSILLLFSLHISDEAFAQDTNLNKENTSLTVLGETFTGEISKKMVWQTLGILKESYMVEYKLHATEDELISYKKWLSKISESSRQREIAEKQRLEEKEANQNLSENEQIRLDSLGSTLVPKSTEQLLAEFEEEIKGLPMTEQKKQRKKLEEANLFMFQFLHSQIESWKVNKSMFEKYGGRVKFQQAGLEPVDAWFTFMQEQEVLGNLLFSEVKHRKSFWQIFSGYVESGFNSAGQADSFAIPLWER